MDADDWGEFADNPAPSALYTKGSDILYQTREGAWVPGKVISIDIGIVPPSYCVEVEGNLREIEEWRLKDASSSAAASTQQQQQQNQQQQPPIDQFDFNGLNINQQQAEVQEEEEEEDDFGEFSAAPEEDPPQLPSSSPPVVVPSFLSSPSHTPSHTPTAASPKLKSPPSTGGSNKSHHDDDDSIEKSFRKFLSVAAPNVAHTLEEQDAFAVTIAIEEQSNNVSTRNDNDFGDFADAPSTMGQPTTTTASVATPAAAAVVTSVSSSPFLRNLAHLHDSSSNTGAPVHNSNAVQEYGVAWTLILNTSVKCLESGRLFWENSSTTSPNTTITNSVDSIQLELLENHRVQVYFAALARIYYVASLVRLSAEMLGLLHFVQELDVAWTRCTAAWTSTDPNTEIKPLSWVSSEAAKKVGFGSILDDIDSVEAEVAVALATMNLDDFPRMLAWSEGLDSILLLPLSVLTGRTGEERKPAAVDWPLEGSGRQCLSVVANFWLGCVSSIPPELE